MGDEPRSSALPGFLHDALYQKVFAAESSILPRGARLETMGAG
jgi:hypothetical protein